MEGRAGDVSDGEPYLCEDCPPTVDFVGRSVAVRDALALMRAVGTSGLNPILILGETGTGKELAARTVHHWACGGEKPFVAVNCASLNANLLESELFGHVRGAFTGADREKQGLVELAGRGTLMLDEVSEMPAGLQAKLLRVLQERQYRKVGGTAELAMEATVVATSNRALDQETGSEAFRRDLYYRLAVLPIRLAPLRSPQRRDDIPLLARYFLANSRLTIPSRPTGFTPEAMAKLMGHHWAGNARELRNVVERAIVLERQERIRPVSVMFDHSPIEAPREAPPAAEAFSLETAEREFILRALKETGWQRNRAAALLGITRATLYAKLKRYDIKVPGFDDKSEASSVGDGVIVQPGVSA
jgi:transcriptional regulator with PAS, ATPase and Fis domain